MGFQRSCGHIDYAFNPDCLGCVKYERDQLKDKVEEARIRIRELEEAPLNLSGLVETKKKAERCEAAERKVKVAGEQFAFLLAEAMNRLCVHKDGKCIGEGCPGAELGKWAIRECVPSRFANMRHDENLCAMCTKASSVVVLMCPECAEAQGHIERSKSKKQVCAWCGGTGRMSPMPGSELEPDGKCPKCQA